MTTQGSGGFTSNPVALLLGTGICLGLLAPLARLAHDAGIDPYLWAAMISLVPGLILASLAFRRGFDGNKLELAVFGAASGLFAYVIPNAILFLAIPHIGSGLAGLMFALSPVTTAILSIAFGIRPPNRAMMAAVGLGFVGAVMIVAARNSLNLAAASHWLLVALVVPVSLGIGNVYRTAKWPAGATPLQVGAASNVLSAPLLMLASFFNNGGLVLAPLAQHVPLVAGQWAVSLAMFSLFFRLQWIGGPTYLSQIGYVASAVSLVLGVSLLGESYPVMVWAGAILIIAGIAASAWDVIARRKPASLS